MNKKTKLLLGYKFQVLMMVTQLLLVIVTITCLYQINSSKQEMENQIWSSLQSKFGTGTLLDWISGTTTQLVNIERTQREHTLMLENIELFTTP